MGSDAESVGIQKKDRESLGEAARETDLVGGKV